MTPEEMKARTMQYALRIARLTQSLPRNTACNHVGGQLLRAGTSVAANYRAACRARSKAEFIAKLGIVEEEADESLFWMEFLVAAGMVKQNNLGPLAQEGGEILSIVVSSKRTARSRSRK